MNEIKLKYGCNPNQKNAKIYMKDNSSLPIKVINGNPGYINFLDALNSWQLVKELKTALNFPAAASFKHVSPTSAAIGKPMSKNLKKACFVDDIDGLNASSIACAYARARGTDRLCSFGDWVALSDNCDITTAKILSREVSDGIIAPGYDKDALEILMKKKNENYNIVQIDDDYEPANIESKDVFGISFEQSRNNCKIDKSILNNIVSENNDLSKNAVQDLILSMITLKYTQSNSVCFAYDGQAIGVGAGQQSRIHCTRLAANKADTWFLRQHEKVLLLPFKDEIKRAEKDNIIDAYINKNEEDVCSNVNWTKYFTKQPNPLTDEEKADFMSTITGVSLGSDAFFPFGDSLERAYKSGVSYVIEAGGSIRDNQVIETANKYNMVLAFCGIRLFHH